MSSLELRQVRKCYDGQNDVITDLNVQIDDGEYVVLVGPSGCGKSTILRMIAGLEGLSGGEMHLRGRRIDQIAADKRGMAMVFQSYALYPHLSVADNIGFPLKMAGVDKRTINTRVADVAAHVQIDHLLTRKPMALSGGQQQRVAIARALIRNPEVLLLDEPLSNLDAALRHDMRVYLNTLHQETGKTMIHVTHDQVEAMTLADRIVVLNKGHIAQIGTPEALYDTPNSLFVAQFIGAPKMNILPVTVDENGRPSVNGQVLALPVPQHTAFIGVRPHQWQIGGAADVEMRIDVAEPLGQTRLYYGQFAGESVVVESSTRFEVGDMLPLSLTAAAVHVFDADGQRI